MAPRWFFLTSADMLASFIQIGDRYFATIKSPGGEEVLKDGDTKIPFPSAVSAVAAARRRIELISRKKPEPEPKPRYEKPDVVMAWEKERQAQFDRDRLAVLGVEVVNKRRFRCR